jgi:hypothetical protein
MNVEYKTRLALITDEEATGEVKVIENKSYWPVSSVLFATTRENGRVLTVNPSMLRRVVATHRIRCEYAVEILIWMVFLPEVSSCPNWVKHY